MKRMAIGIIISFCCVLANATVTKGAEVKGYVAPPELATSPIIISGYSLTNRVLNYVQLYNTSDRPVSLNGWVLETTTSTNLRVRIASLEGYIAPSNYLIVGHTSLSGVDFIDNLQTDFSEGNYGELQLTANIGSFASVESVKLTKDGIYQRKISSSTNKYLSTFEPVVDPALYGGGFYVYPSSIPVVPVEILANPRRCSPLDEGLDCKDYIKLYNPSRDVVDLSQYRLRVGYKGQNATASNTFLLSGTIQPNHYAVIFEDAEGREVNFTNTGGYVWFEDTYGLQMYESTVRLYEDASPTSREGNAWALHDDVDLWEWTSTPTPWDAPNRFPAPISLAAKPAEILNSCPAGQYRSEDTHRCRVLAVQSAATACPIGQYRSAETNRCRAMASAESEVKPCEAGYERNPETNRCRKKAEALGSMDFKTDPVTEVNKSFSGWWTIGGICMLAVGYGLWEWRDEVLSATRRLSLFFTSRK